MAPPGGPMTHVSIPLAFERLEIAESRRRSRSFLELMKTRRTVRDFAPDGVPQDVIDTAIATASSAPSGANKQPWRFVVVRDPGVKRAIREAAEAEEREFRSDVIDTAIATASSAPSGANKQPWRFVVVRDPGVKRAIREAAEAEEREFYEGRVTAEWREDLAAL